MKKQLAFIVFLFTLSFFSLAKTYKPASAADDPTITPLAQWGDLVTDIELVGNTIYVTNKHNIYALGLSGTSVTEKGWFTESSEGCQYTSLSEDNGILAATAQSFWCQYNNQLKLFDISNPNFVIQSGVHNIIGTGGARSVRQYQGTSYIANAYGGLVAISTPGQEDPPTYLPDAPSGHQLDFFDIDIAGDIAYITDLGNHILHIVGVANNTLTPLSTLDLGGNLSGIDVEGQYAYVTGQSGGLSIVDISNPQNPQLVSIFNTYGGGAFDIQIKNGYAFLANSEYGIEIVDVSDPNAPKGVIHYDTPGRAQQLEVDDNNIYVADTEGGLQIFSYSNLAIPEQAPEPFLELPWNYEGRSFGDAATSMFSFFDHEYPLLSAGSTLSEPISERTTTRGYDNIKLPKPDRQYSSHDGYDWGRKAQLQLGSPVLAAGNGCAKLMTSCVNCGNAILIDHGNHYQTRYYHLQSAGLATFSTNQCVNVIKGQQIGLMGATGNTDGAHIHFMVVEDKNRDGDFEDNIPDGITDPFGWQTEAPDPWPNYSFFYKNQNRTGNNSHYLWIHQIPNLNEDLPSNGGVFNLDNTTVTFPSGIVSDPSKLSIKKSPWVRISEELESVGTSVNIIVTNFFGNLITQFNQFFTVAFNFSNEDLSRVNPQTLQIYSSNDGVNWNPEQTSVDLQAKTASTQVNHLTQFALIGERLDTQAPVTQIQQTNNTFSLSATDNYSGVDYILYRLDEGDWQEYTTPITVGSGEHTVHFYSVDNHENIEEEMTHTFTISPLSNLKLQYYPDPTATGESVNAILPDFNIVNTGGTSVPLKELTIRYYFTRDSQPQNMYFYCDYAKIGCTKVKGKIVTLASPVNDADSYIEIGFTSGTLAANGKTQDILVDITRADEGYFNQLNDYSFENRNPQFIDWSKVTLYRNGQLVWGNPPN